MCRKKQHWLGLLSVSSGASVKVVELSQRRSGKNMFRIVAGEPNRDFKFKVAHSKEETALAHPPGMGTNTNSLHDCWGRQPDTRPLDSVSCWRPDADTQTLGLSLPTSVLTPTRKARTLLPAPRRHATFGLSPLPAPRRQRNLQTSVSCKRPNADTQPSDSVSCWRPDADT